MDMEQIEDGWIQHDGSPCPLPPGTIVEVRLRNGEQHKGRALSEELCMGWDQWVDDYYPELTIAAYRRVTPKQELPSPWVNLDPGMPFLTTGLGPMATSDAWVYANSKLTFIGADFADPNAEMKQRDEEGKASSLLREELKRMESSAPKAERSPLCVVAPMTHKLGGWGGS